MVRRPASAAFARSGYGVDGRDAAAPRAAARHALAAASSALALTKCEGRPASNTTAPTRTPRRATPNGDPESPSPLEAAERPRLRASSSPEDSRRLFRASVPPEARARARAKSRRVYEARESSLLPAWPRIRFASRLASRVRSILSKPSNAA